MKIKLVVLSVFTFCCVFNAEAQKLKKFGSSVEKKIGPKTIKVPYTDVISYLGYASAGNEDEIVDGKKFHYIYLWIPAVAPELGVRMLSPVAKTKIKGAISSEAYTENASSSDYFDTYITLERSTIFKKEDITVDAAKKKSYKSFNCRFIPYWFYNV